MTHKAKLRREAQRIFDELIDEQDLPVSYIQENSVVYAALSSEAWRRARALFRKPKPKRVRASRPRSGKSGRGRRGSTPKGAGTSRDPESV